MPSKCKKLYKAYDKPVIRNFNFRIEAGEKVAIIGENGIGKTTLLRCLAGDLAPDNGTIKWAERARLGYFAQDHTDDFARDEALFDWLRQWARDSDDDQIIRATLGRLLFTGDDAKKSVKVISGGEEGRLLFGKLMLQRPNVLLLDEPTNHLDMESIESLNTALEKYQGTLIFVSHDREFVSSLATRVFEMTAEGMRDYSGGYEDYLRDRGLAA